MTRPRKGREANTSPRPNQLDKLVLIGLADQADDGDWSVMIGAEEIAGVAMCTARALFESVERLEAAGYLRRRQVQIEGSNATTWSRYYLLSPLSPVVQKLIEVDWSTPEAISKAELRRLQARVRARVTPRPLNQVHGVAASPPEPGSPPPPEPGSETGGEPGSGLTVLSSPQLKEPPPARVRATVPAVDEVRTTEEEMPSQDPNDGTASEAEQVTAELAAEARRRRHRGPREPEEGDLVALIGRHLANGWTRRALMWELTREMEGVRAAVPCWISRLRRLGTPPAAGPAAPGPQRKASGNTVTSDDLSADDLLARGLPEKFMPTRLRVVP